MKRALILAGVKWNTTMQRHHMVAERLVELGFEVYFVEGIVSSSFSISKSFARIIQTFRPNNASFQASIKTGEVKIINTSFVNPHRGLFDLYNAYRWNVLRKKIPKSFDLVINYLPILTTERIVNDVSSKTLIYDCVRDFSNWGGYPSNIGDIEDRLVDRADYVMVDSYYLYNKMIALYPEKSIKQMLPMLKAGQAGIFAENKLPQKIKNVSYIGQVGSHIDVDKLNVLNDAGYNVHVFGNSLIELTGSVTMHGFISSPTELAHEIIMHSDALIIPYKGNMDGVIPAKLFECLATNLPVYVSDFYDARILDQMLYVYRDADELVSNIAAYDAKLQAERNKVTQQYLSEHSTQHELSVLDDILEHR